ncbi:AMP-binding enzyme [Aliidiomarina sp. Khilg15.8]
MSTLLSYLSNTGGKRQPRVHSYSTGVQSTLSFKAVAKQAQAMRQVYKDAAGARVALTLTATTESLVNLVALDGFVSELTLLPVDKSSPAECDFHVTERGKLRQLRSYESDHLPVQTEWALLDEQDHLVSYRLNELAQNELVATGSSQDPLHWGVLQEPADLAGLLVWLRALRAGEDIVLAQADSLSALLGMFVDAGVTAIAAPPRLWRNFMATSEIAKLPLRLGVINGGLVDTPTLQRLQAIFVDAIIIHSFSNTAAGISWLITDGEPGLPAALFEAEDDSIVLDIEDEDQLLLAFTGSGATIKTGYRVQRDASGRVFIRGHLANAVVVGGREVQPEEVEQALLGVNGVADVQASSMPDPVLGELIRVDVLAPGHRSVAAQKEFKKVLQEHCRDHLEPWQRPVRYYFY